MEAAETLGELSDIVQSQQLQNQAAREMEALREALRQLENRESQQGEPGENGESSESDGGQGEQQDPSSEAGDAAASTPQEGEGGTPQEGSQSGSAEGASEFTAGEAQEGAPSDQSMPPIAGDLQNLEPTGTGGYADRNRIFACTEDRRTDESGSPTSVAKRPWRYRMKIYRGQTRKGVKRRRGRNDRASTTAACLRS